MHGGRHAWQGTCMVGGVHGRGCVWQEGVHGGGACMVGSVHGRGICMAGGCTWQGCVWQGGGVHGRGCAWQGAYIAGEMAAAADGTHPAGMHSCIPFLYTIDEPLVYAFAIFQYLLNPTRKVGSPWHCKLRYVLGYLCTYVTTRKSFSLSMLIFRLILSS